MTGLSPLHRRRTPPRHMVERGPGDGPKPHHTWHYLCGFGPSEGEARNPPPTPLSFPHPPLICPPDGDWQLQVLPGAPGTARQGPTRIIMLVNDGGNATQPRAPGHERPRAALRATRHGRPSAATRAPGADVPPATTAEAPGQYCLRAALRAPGHERPRAALRATRHGRPSAATRAPGADVPPAIPAEAPGQYRLRAAPSVPVSDRSRLVQKAPGHGRPRTASSDVVGHDRPRATLAAPGADVPLATTAGAPGQHRLRAVANATVALPAGQPRLRQECLPRVPANPRTLTYPHTHRHTAHTRTAHRDTRYAQSRESTNPPLSTWWRGAGGEVFRSPTTHQVHPAIQIPPHPRPCSTAHTGLSHHHPSRAPPHAYSRLVIAA